jgi:hypothetical protein
MVALALAVCAALATAVQGVGLERRIDEVRESERAFESSAIPAANSPHVAAGSQPSREHVAAVNAAVMRLNLPWPAMLDEIERAGTRDVSLLAIEPDVRRGVVRLLGEADGADGLVDYVRGLSTRPAFSSVVILKHKMADGGTAKTQAGAAPVEFTLELTWRDAAAEKTR